MSAREQELAVSIDDVLAADQRIAGLVRETPLIEKLTLSEQYGRPVLLKYEHLQRTGSFKLRGALNLMLQLDEKASAAGVVAASAGNHAQGVAVAARERGIRARITMPEDATLSKIEATRHYGAEVVLAGRNLSEALAEAQSWADAHGAQMVHPFDDPRIVAGAGTLGLEIARQLPEVANVIVPIGGGGLFSGVAIALRAANPRVRLIGVQSDACRSLAASLEAGHPVEVPAAPTLADGIAVKRPGAITLPIVRALMDQLVTVDEDAIARAMVWLIERGKQVVEGSGAVSLAALKGDEIELADGPVVALLSGGNIDSMALIQVIRQGLTSAGRYATMTVTIGDRPGELARLLTALGDARVNVLSVEHHREGVHLRIGETRVEITFQTRNSDHVDAVLQTVLDAGWHAAVHAM